MKSSHARPGRVFVIRLEHGDIIHECLERFAAEHGLTHAVLTLHGGADHGSTLVTGPRDGAAPPPIEPQMTTLDGVHEVVGTGTLFPDANGTPILHVHLACGRGRETITGCIRTGVRTWHVLEVVLTELLDSTARRLPDADSGFELLVP
jgi:predicted DNA-binding protein with PD1-like motif